MTGAPWTNEEDSILKSYFLLESASRIASRIPGRTKSSIQQRAIRLGLKTGYFWSAEDDAVLRKKYSREGYAGVKELLPGKSAANVSRRAKILGIERDLSWQGWEIEILKSTANEKISVVLERLPHRTKFAIQKKIAELNINPTRSRYHSFNREFFDRPGVLNSYWAGFIAADGCVRDNGTIAIALKDSDGHHIERFSQDIGFTGDVKRSSFIRHGKRSGKAVVAICNARDAIESLRLNYNITPRKSLTLSPPESLDERTALAFIKGYLDGDGSINIQKRKASQTVSIAALGTLEMMSWIKSIFDDICPCDPNKRQAQVVKHKSIYCFRVSGTRAEKILQKLCEVETPELSRKWNPARMLIADRTNPRAEVVVKSIG